jgi:hypothetical protein
VDIALLDKVIMEEVLPELLLLHTTQRVEVVPVLLELPSLPVEHTVVLVVLELHLISLALEFHMLEVVAVAEQLADQILL